MKTFSQVYFIRDLETLFIKIGVSINVTARMAEIRSGLSHGRCALLATVVGDIGREHRLHEMFRDDRVHGEWFKPSDRLMEYIAEARRNRAITSGQDDWLFEPGYVTAADLCRAFDVSPGTVAAWIASGKLPAANSILDGRHAAVVSMDDVRRFYRRLSREGGPRGRLELRPFTAGSARALQFAEGAAPPVLIKDPEPAA